MEKVDLEGLVGPSESEINELVMSNMDAAVISALELIELMNIGTKFGVGAGLDDTELIGVVMDAFNGAPEIMLRVMLGSLMVERAKCTCRD